MSRSNVVTSRGLTSPPTRFDRAIRCESQTRAPALTDRGSEPQQRWNVTTSRLTRRVFASVYSGFLFRFP